MPPLRCGNGRTGGAWQCRKGKKSNRSAFRIHRLEMFGALLDDRDLDGHCCLGKRKKSISNDVTSSPKSSSQCWRPNPARFPSKFYIFRGFQQFEREFELQQHW